MPYYALLDPTGEESYDLFLLYKAKKYKRFFLGMFYLPRRRRLAPVFKIPWEVGDEVFEVMPSTEVDDAYRMLCVSCGRCCALNSGAFAFEDEIPPVLEKLGQRSLPSREVSIYSVGSSKLYDLAVGPGGLLRLLHPGGLRDRAEALVEEQADRMPDPVLLAVRRAAGEPYVKVAVKRVRGKPVPVYQRVAESELKRIAERERARVREIHRKLTSARARRNPPTGS